MHTPQKTAEWITERYIYQFYTGGTYVPPFYANLILKSLTVNPLISQYELQSLCKYILRGFNMIENCNKEIIQNLITTEAAAKLLGCTVRKLEADRIKGGGIPYIKVGRIVRYDIECIKEFIKQNTYTSTSGGKPG